MIYFNCGKSSPASSHLKLSTDRPDPRSSMRAFLTRTKTEIPFSLSISWASKQENVFACGGKLCKLVESQAAALSRSDSISGSLGKPKGDNSQALRNVEESYVVGDCAHNSNNTLKFVITLGSRSAVMRKMFHNAWNRDGVAVKSWLIKTFMNDLVEFRIGSSGEERVKLH